MGVAKCGKVDATESEKGKETKNEGWKTIEIFNSHWEKVKKILKNLEKRIKEYGNS